jgi:hypothetical protein
MTSGDRQGTSRIPSYPSDSEKPQTLDAQPGISVGGAAVSTDVVNGCGSSIRWERRIQPLPAVRHQRRVRRR